jgi:DNA gyrase subunit A
VVKRVAFADLPGVSSAPFAVLAVESGDSLGWAAITTGGDQVLLVTAAGQAIRFDEQTVRPMGLPAGGVRGVRLQSAEDRVVALAVVRARSDLLVVGSDGRAKRAPLSEYPAQGRYGRGVITARFGRAGGQLAGACVVQAGDQVVLVTEKGAAKTLRARNAPRKGRSAQGQSIIALRASDAVSGVFRPLPRPDLDAKGQ